MGGRLLPYEITPGAAGSRMLTAHLHVSYHFPHEEGWAPAGRGRWKNAFRSAAESTWSNKYQLYAEGGFLSSESVVGIALRIHEVRPRSVAANRHWWVAVNAPNRPRNEWLTRVIYRPNATLPHSDQPVGGSALLKVHAYDVECGWTHMPRGEGGDGSTMQRGTDHEVGHMLGMQHPYCNEGHVDPGDASSASCYWRPGGQDGRSAQSYRLMGIGNVMSPHEFVWAQKLMNQVDGRRYTLRRAPGGGSLATCRP